MDDYTQLAIGLIMALAIFVGAFAMPLRRIMALVLILAPFELINSHYGTSSTGLVYLAALALWVRGGLPRLPLGGAVMGILFVYLLSLALAEARPLDHVIYLIRILPGFLIFYMAYNYAREGEDQKGIMNVFLVVNLIVLGLSLLQLAGGSQQVSLFGIEEFSLMKNRESQGRINGPFGAEFTSEYLALMSLFLAYLLMQKSRDTAWPRWGLWALLAGNLAIMVATGSRGGFLVLLAGVLWGGFLFRRVLGAGRALAILLVTALVATAMAWVVIRYTHYNVLFERLEGTEIKSGVIDSRSVTWPTAWEAIKKHPILGYGPRLRLWNDKEEPIPGHDPIPYPHSLPLFLLYTLGAVGLLAYLVFFGRLLIRFHQGTRLRDDGRAAGFARLGLLLLTLFLLDEIKIEFLRFIRSDYQAIVFTLFGALLAMSEPRQGQGTASPMTKTSPRQRLLHSSQTPGGDK